MDLTLFRTINSLAAQGPVLAWLVVFCASYLQYVVGAVVIAASLWPHRRPELVAAALTSALVARLVVVQAIYLIVERARPYVALTGVTQLVRPTTYESMHALPSGHATFFFALATAVWMHDHRLGALAYAAAVVISLARIAAGVHWPTDVVAGAVVGSLVAWLCVRCIPALHPVVYR
jgi:undecaprenyl-diphosphatase